MTNSTNQDSSPEDRQVDFVQLPRWIIYSQAMLLVLVATTCFICGIFVGSFGRSETPPDANPDFRVSGKVQLNQNNRLRPDSGAVVILLPETPEKIIRQDPATITPPFFQPLENPAIDSIRDAGGHIVRANLDGDYEFFVEPGRYALVVISNSSVGERRQQLQREQVALLSQYFLPVENLIGRHEYVWQELVVSIKDVDVGSTEF